MALIHHCTLTGMNLLNGFENHPSAFKWVTAGSLAMGTALFMTATALIRYVKSLSGTCCVRPLDKGPQDWFSHA